MQKSYLVIVIGEGFTEGSEGLRLVRHTSGRWWDIGSFTVKLLTMLSKEFVKILSMQVWLQCGCWWVHTETVGAKPEDVKHCSKSWTEDSDDRWRFMLKSPVMNEFSLGSFFVKSSNNLMKFALLPFGGRYTTPNVIGVLLLEISTNKASMSGLE